MKNMDSGIDIAIIVGFLAITLIIGIGSTGKIKNIKDYALGGRNFSTGALVSTIVATCASASGFFTDINTTYTDGLFYIVPAMCLVLGLLIIAYIFVPRMGEFLGSTSIAEVMGNLYGREVRVITAVAGIIGAISGIAVQFKACGNITGYFIGISQTEAIVISGIIVTFYSSVGGIRAVTTTDILQFFTFGFVIPLISIIIWNQMYFDGQSINHIFALDNFKPSELVNTDNPKFWPMISLMFYFTIPTLRPAGFQRILIGKNLKQVKKAFIISALLLGIIILATCWISILVLNINNKLESNNLLGFILDKYTYTGLKGLIIIGIIAMAMSTADSILNITSVLFSNDILAPLNIGINKQLPISKWFSIILGGFSIIFALYGQNLLSIILLGNSFYMPVVTVPLILTIMGFRSSTKSVLICMAAGFVTVAIIKTFSLALDPIFCGMLVNLVFLFGSHYLLAQPGGWIGIKDKKSHEKLIAEEERARAKKQATYKKFSFLEYCKKHSPNNEVSYTGLGVYFILYTIATMYSTQTELLGENRQIILAIYQIMMITGVVMAMHPIWPLSIRPELKETIARVLWPVTTFYMLILFNSLFMLVSEFGTLQFSIFSVNLVISSILVGWRMSSIMIGVGIMMIIGLYDSFLSSYNIDFSLGSPGFIAVYVLMITATTLIIFIKPKQEYQRLTEEKNGHLNGRIGVQEEQIRKALGLREEFIRNIQHEYNAPRVGISSMADSLIVAYDHLNDEERIKAIAHILKSSARLEVFDSNISALSKLSKDTYKLELEDINLSNLVYNSVEVCRRLYENNKEDREFVLYITDNISIRADKRYLVQVIENLIINAISYCRQGKITIILKQGKDEEDKDIVTFVITDEGVGIPQDELLSIFDEFVVSSNTHTYAGGRGIGLALAKRVIEVHGGMIKAESDGVKGSTFTFVLPTQTK